VNLLIALTLGAGVLALWVHFRFPGLAPEGVRGAVVHVGVAMLLGMVIVPTVGALIVGPFSPIVRAYLAIFAIGLPVLIYSLLVAVWVITLAQAAMARYKP